MATNDQITHVARLYRGLKTFIDLFQRNPFDFLYEADIQAILFARIWDEFHDASVRLRGGYCQNPSMYGGEGSISTVPIKREYGRDFDVALIDEGCLVHFTPEAATLGRWTSDRFWQQPVRAAIEVKYCQITDRAAKRRRDLEQDVAKLLTCQQSIETGRKFLGLAILFVQSDAFALSHFVDGNTMEAKSEPDAGVFKYVVTPTATIGMSV